jgi:phosphoglycerol transferase MdoB-like AlkP superfamily enzyme
MRTWFYYFLKLFFFWFLFFFLYRIVFLIVTKDFLRNIPFHEVVECTFHGLKLDLSFVCYFSFFPILMVMVMHFISKPLVTKILKVTLNLYVITFVMVVALLQASELATYEDWHAKINVKVFFYLSHPMEGIRSARAGHMLIFWGSFIVQSIIAVFIYLKWIRPRNIQLETRTWRSILRGTLTGILTMGMSFLGARGTLRPIPIDLSTAFYSKNFSLNDAAVNTPWHFMHSILENRTDFGVNPYALYFNSRAEKTVKGLFHCYTETFPSILTTARPNIVFIVQEGVSANMVGALGGTPGFSPEYDSLAKESLIFPNLYSNGWTSDVGHLSIFAGFPALPRVSAINMPEKYRQLPSFTKSLNNVGYSVNYYYGGQSTYGNIKGFMLDGGTDKVVDEDRLPGHLERGRLGIHDPLMYDWVATDLPQLKQPYCGIFFTVSTHSPYDIPTRTSLEYTGPEESYARAVYYADSSLGAFIDAIKQNGQYDNTLIVIVPDHSHAATVDYHMLSPERYRIGMLLGGGALKAAYRGKSIPSVASQIDISKTLLEQLEINASDFVWSKNILDPDAPQFAQYVYPGGMGWIKADEYVVWDYEHHACYLEKLNRPENKRKLEREGKSYLQVVYQEFMDM